MDAIAKFNEIPDDLRLMDSERLKESTLQTGFIAQEVEEASERLGFDFSGVDAPKNDSDHYSIRYAEFTVPLVKAVQELHQNLEDEKTAHAESKEKIKYLEAQLEAIRAALLAQGIDIN